MWTFPSKSLEVVQRDYQACLRFPTWHKPWSGIVAVTSPTLVLSCTYRKSLPNPNGKKKFEPSTIELEGKENQDILFSLKIPSGSFGDLRWNPQSNENFDKIEIASNDLFLLLTEGGESVSLRLKGKKSGKFEIDFFLNKSLLSKIIFKIKPDPTPSDSTQVLQCTTQSLPNIQNASWVFSGSSVLDGDVVTSTCNSGFLIDPTPKAKCRNGLWIKNPEECISLDHLYLKQKFKEELAAEIKNFFDRPPENREENILLVANHVYDSDRPEDSVGGITILESTLEHLGKVHRVHYTALSEYIASGQMRDKTLVVLSGGSGQFYRKDMFQLEHWYLRNTILPIIGICQGLQILTKIFDSADHYKLTDARLDMFEDIDVIGMNIPMYYVHGWGVCLDDLNVMKSIANRDLCYGDNCQEGRRSTVMAIYHPTRPVFAFQGHPERSGDPGLAMIRHVLDVLHRLRDWNLGI